MQRRKLYDRDTFHSGFNHREVWKIRRHVVQIDLTHGIGQEPYSKQTYNVAAWSHSIRGYLNVYNHDGWHLFEQLEYEIETPRDAQGIPDAAILKGHVDRMRSHLIAAFAVVQNALQETC